MKDVPHSNEPTENYHHLCTSPQLCIAFLYLSATYFGVSQPNTALITLISSHCRPLFTATVQFNPSEAMQCSLRDGSVGWLVSCSTTLVQYQMDYGTLCYQESKQIVTENYK